MSPQPLDASTKGKISMFCHVAPEQVVGVHDLSSVYHVPLLLESQGGLEFLVDLGVLMVVVRNCSVFTKALGLDFHIYPPGACRKGQGLG